jgi:hypothetical protein
MLASAHHAFQAEFDVDKPVTLRGTVVRVELINPRAWIHIDVKAADRQTVRWMIEASSPNSLIRRGLSKATTPIGTEVIVDGYVQRWDEQGQRKGITLPDGHTFLLGANPQDGQDGRP